MTSAGRRDSPAGQGWEPDGFINHLAAGWQLGGSEAFIQHFHPIFHPDVVSEQPLSRPRKGIDALESQFRQIFRILPGVTATICSWAASQPNVYVEFELHTPARNRPLELRTCDRFTISGGLITHRSVYFDSAVLLRFLACHPGRWHTALIGS
jgi:SnoaL-like domain